MTAPALLSLSAAQQPAPPTHLEVQCGRCGQLAVIVTIPGDRDIPKIGADAKHVIRGAVKLVTRFVPIKAREATRAFLELLVDGRYAECFRRLAVILDELPEHEYLTCASCVRSSQS